MIKAVLSAIPTYYMSFYRLSTRASLSLDGFLKKFLWDGSIDWEIADCCGAIHRFTSDEAVRLAAGDLSRVYGICLIC